MFSKVLFYEYTDFPTFLPTIKKRRNTDYWPGDIPTIGRGAYRLCWGPREVSDFSQGSLRLFRADYFQLSPRLNMTIMMNVAGDDENDYGNDDDKHRC